MRITREEQLENWFKKYLTGKKPKFFNRARTCESCCDIVSDEYMWQFTDRQRGEFRWHSYWSYLCSHCAPSWGAAKKFFWGYVPEDLLPKS